MSLPPERSPMTLTATCPKCATSSPVPEEAVGRKVRCKRCQNIFVVEATPRPDDTFIPPETPKPANAPRAASRPAARPPSSAGAREGPPTRSQRTLWMILGVALLVVLGGGGLAVYLVMNEP